MQNSQTNQTISFNINKACVVALKVKRLAVEYYNLTFTIRISHITTGLNFCFSYVKSDPAAVCVEISGDLMIQFVSMFEMS